MNNDIDILELATAHTLVRERNLTTGERWELVIRTGIYTEAWVLNINNGNKWFGASGILSVALQSAVEQWERHCDRIDRENEGR